MQVTSEFCVEINHSGRHCWRQGRALIFKLRHSYGKNVRQIETFPQLDNFYFVRTTVASTRVQVPNLAQASNTLFATREHRRYDKRFGVTKIAFFFSGYAMVECGWKGGKKRKKKGNYICFQVNLPLLKKLS